MKKRISFIILCLVFTFLLAFSTLAFASEGIKVYINDEQLFFDVSPTNINGTTLVPMRAIFEELGANVVWDSQSKTITGTKGDTVITLKINSSTATKNDQTVNLSVPVKLIKDSTMVPLRFISESFDCEVLWDRNTKNIDITAADVYGRNNPAPIGTEQTIKISNYSQEYTANLKVNSIIRGDAAWDEIYKTNKFNAEPASDTEYIIINITATIADIKDNSAVTFFHLDFDCFSKNNTEYSYVSVVIPDPELRGDVYAGGSLSGNIVVLVDKTDDSPKIVYGRNYDGTGGIWFSLK